MACLRSLSHSLYSLVTKCGHYLLEPDGSLCLTRLGSLTSLRCSELHQSQTLALASVPWPSSQVVGAILVKRCSALEGWIFQLVLEFKKTCAWRIRRIGAKASLMSSKNKR